MDFVIDITGDHGTTNSPYSLSPNIKNTKSKSIPQTNNPIIYNGKSPKTISAFNSLAQNDFAFTKKKVNEILKKSAVLTPGFEQLHTVPRYEVSKKTLQKEHRKEREKTKGKQWYGLPATEMTEEIKHDLEVLQMRSVLDPKRFYKKNDLKVLPKYFQVGKVVDSPLDYYTNRLTRKERKKTLVDELLADAEFSKYNKRKYKEIIEERQKTHYKAWRQAKKLKKKNK